jgi:UTP--glucose-1-phosphate uridylyltransferase
MEANMKIKKAIIPCAGFGTRFFPITKSFPKEMLPIINVPSLEYIIREAIDSGIEEIILVVSSNKGLIKHYFNDDPELNKALKNKAEDISYLGKTFSNIKFTIQKEMNGLGNAILCAKSFIPQNEPFAVLLGDDLYYSEKVPVLKQMILQYEKYGATILGCRTVDDEDVHKYGIVNISQIIDGKNSKINGMVEKPKSNPPSNVAVLGRYIFDYEIFDKIESTKVNPGEEVSLTPAIQALSLEKDVYAYEYDGIRYDIGDKLGYVKATIEYTLRNPEFSKDLIKYLTELIKDFK